MINPQELENMWNAEWPQSPVIKYIYEVIIIIKTLFSAKGAQIWEILTRIQNAIFMEADHCYHDASHQIWDSYKASYSKIIRVTY